MTRYNVNQRLKLAVARAAEAHPTHGQRHVSPICIRHSTGMHLLQADVPFNIIALYLGHETPATTPRYVDANLAMKEAALARLEASTAVVPPCQPSDELRQFPR